MLAVSIDTEEDDWTPRPGPVTLRNIRELPRLHQFLTWLNLRPTYFVNYQVFADLEAAAVIQEIAGSGNAEIGAHLHPWNTPPVNGALGPGETMLLNLAEEVQEAKIRAVTDKAGEVLGVAPTAFRAGRFGFGAGTARALRRTGYSVDSSVTPFFNWGRYDNGPSFVGAPLSVYRLGAGQEDVRRPAAGGDLIEVPISGGFNRWPVRSWGALQSVFSSGVGRAVAGVAARSTLARKVSLSPERDGVGEMLGLSRRILAARIPILHAFWHSPSMVPGLTPFSETRKDVDRLLYRIEAYVEDLRRIATVTAATVSEAARALVPDQVAAC